jgi:hypothetical protein
MNEADTGEQTRTHSLLRTPIVKDPLCLRGPGRLSGTDNIRDGFPVP